MMQWSQWCAACRFLCAVQQQRPCYAGLNEISLIRLSGWYLVHFRNNDTPWNTWIKNSTDFWETRWNPCKSFSLVLFPFRFPLHFHSFLLLHFLSDVIYSTSLLFSLHSPSSSPSPSQFSSVHVFTLNPHAYGLFMDAMSSGRKYWEINTLHITPRNLYCNESSYRGHPRVWFWNKWSVAALTKDNRPP